MSQKNFIILISILLYLPPLLWGNYFMDDSYRSILGYYEWIGDYRPVADLIYYVLGQGLFLDLYPYTYIIQIVICAYFVFLATEKVKKTYKLNKKYEKLVALSFFTVFLNPFFLQNIYFRYDSLPMMLSIICICLPFIYEYKKLNISFICCLTTLLTYQSSIVGYPILVCFYVLFLITKETDQKKIIFFIAKQFFIFAFALFSFLLISKYIIEPNKYASKNLNFIFSDSNWSSLLYENIVFSVKNLIITNKPLDYVIITIILIFGYFTIWGIIKNYKANFLFKLFVIIGITFVIVLGLINTNIFLYQPRLHARTYIGFGFVNLFFYLVLIVYYFQDAKRREIIFINYILIYIVVLYFSISAANFNALKDVKKTDENIMFLLSNDIKKVKNNEIYLIAFGSPGYTERYKIMLKSYPIIKMTAISEIDVNTHGYFYAFLNNFNFDFSYYTNVNFDEQIKFFKKTANMKPIMESGFYKIYSDRTTMIVVFKDNGAVNVKSCQTRFD